MWFETQLLGEIGFSCAPTAPETVYGHVFLPWLEPVCVAEGQEIQVELRVDPVGQDYIWCWDTKIAAHAGTAGRSFQQSTFQSGQFSPASLRKRSAEYVPVLTEAGQAERWLLQAMNGEASLQEIAEAAAERFPRVFSRRGEALRCASELAERLSR